MVDVAGYVDGRQAPALLLHVLSNAEELGPVLEDFASDMDDAHAEQANVPAKSPIPG
jgi:hypothetical protein